MKNKIFKMSFALILILSVFFWGYKINAQPTVISKGSSGLSPSSQSTLTLENSTTAYLQLLSPYLRGILFGDSFDRFKFQVIKKCNLLTMD